MQAWRRLSLRSFLRQLMLRDACVAKSSRDHVPGRCPCNTGYAGTAAAITTILSTAAHAQRCLPGELRWRSCTEQVLLHYRLYLRCVGSRYGAAAVEYLRAGPSPAEWFSAKPLSSTSRRGFPAPSFALVRDGGSGGVPASRPTPCRVELSKAALLNFLAGISCPKFALGGDGGRGGVPASRPTPGRVVHSSLESAQL